MRRLFFILLVFLASCKPAKVKQKESSFEDKQESFVSQEEETVEKKDTLSVEVLKTVKTKDSLSVKEEGSSSFGVTITPSGLDSGERMMTVRDKAGNETTTTLNPGDALSFVAESHYKLQIDWG